MPIRAEIGSGLTLARLRPGACRQWLPRQLWICRGASISALRFVVPLEKVRFYPGNYPGKFRCISVHKPPFQRDFTDFHGQKETARKLLSASRLKWLRG